MGKALWVLREGKCCRERPRHKSDGRDAGMGIYGSRKGETRRP